MRSAGPTSRTNISGTARTAVTFTRPTTAHLLIIRVRNVFDQAILCANGIMIGLLAKLHFATADNGYRDRCNGLIQAFSGEVNRAYLQMGSYMNGLEDRDHRLAGCDHRSGRQCEDTGTRQRRARSQPAQPAVDGRDPNDPLPEGHPAQGKTMQNGQPTAYVCQRSTCSAPIINPVTLSQVLQLPTKVQGQAVRHRVTQPQRGEIAMALRVIGAGSGRTGTNSLKVALEEAARRAVLSKAMIEVFGAFRSTCAIVARRSVG